MYHLKNTQGGNYIPSLYLNSDYKFDPASDRLEKSMEQFTLKIKSTLMLLQQRRKVTPNLQYLLDLMLWLKDHNNYIVVEGDKNLGPFILERSHYLHLESLPRTLRQHKQLQRVDSKRSLLHATRTAIHIQKMALQVWLPPLLEQTSQTCNPHGDYLLSTLRNKKLPRQISTLLAHLQSSQKSLEDTPHK